MVGDMEKRFFEDLSSVVEIPVDGTLSRVLGKEGPVRPVLFAFDRGQELTEHTASVPVIIQVVTGSLTVVASGEEYRLSASSWLYLEADEPHTVVAEEPSRMLLTMIRCR